MGCVDNQSETSEKANVRLRPSIDERLYQISSKITTVEEWEAYIKEYYEAFCAVFAKLETQNNAGKASIHRPVAVITGGQPGAGKSALIATYKNLLKSQFGIDAVINNADFYRFCVPGSYRIATEFPESASVLTDPVVKMMRKNLMEESIAQKQSIIIENTLGDTIVTDRMQQSGTHDIWLALMAVPREESLLSDFERYLKMKDACDVARLVSIAAHDKRYDALDKIASKLENSGVRTIVHSRGKTENDFAVVEYDSADKLSKRFPNALEAMASIRQRSFRENSDGYADRLQNIREKMEGYGMTTDEEEELEKLEGIIEKSLTRKRERGGR